MRKILFLFLLFCTVTLSNAQILFQATSPTIISTQIPGYSEVSTINTITFNYTPSMPPTLPNPIDEDTTTEDPKEYRFGDLLSVNIGMTDGNITTTSLGKVWTLRISIPNALNIGFTFNQFLLSNLAEMYII